MNLNEILVIGNNVRFSLWTNRLYMKNGQPADVVREGVISAVEQDPDFPDEFAVRIGSREVIISTNSDDRKIEII